MLFSSTVFVCVFLPVVFVLYTVLPSLKIKNILLIAASLVFYAYGEPVYVLLMLLSSAVNYLLALFIGKSGKPAVRKLVMVLAVLVNLGVLGYYKYAGFFVGNFNSLTGASVPVPEVTLPVGISFFTFQALSYVIDVYRNTTEAEKNYLNILLYISFFPQLIAGPIVKFHDVNTALRDRKQTPDEVAAGLRRFIVGLAKKVLIANVMGETADVIFSMDASRLNVLSAWLGAAAYMLQIYYDFSGYSDMAIGLGHMFGFTFRENFLHPYTAVNIQDFWRRWHISMSTWFKEYLYIPLGGNRKGKARTCVNKLIVFFCTGLWHGAGWTFIVWGMYHGLFLLLEEYVPALRKLPKAVGKLYSLLVVCVGFVIFRADSMTQAGMIIKNMFAGFSFDPEIVSLTVRQLTPWFLFILVCAVLGAGLLPLLVRKFRERRPDKEKAFTAVSLAASAALLAICIIRLSGNTYNPFIYFRF